MVDMGGIMKKRRLLLAINVALASFFLAACQAPDLSQLRENPLHIVKKSKVFGDGKSDSDENTKRSAAKS